MTNKEILEAILKNGLLKKCIDYQFYKAGMTEYKEDLFQDLCIEILEADNTKLNDAYNKHMNAYITRLIQNNILSVTSRFYKKYKKWDNLKAGDIIDLKIDVEDE